MINTPKELNKMRDGLIREIQANENPTFVSINKLLSKIKSDIKYNPSMRKTSVMNDYQIDVSRITKNKAFTNANERLQELLRLTRQLHNKVFNVS